MFLSTKEYDCVNNCLRKKKYGLEIKKLINTLFNRGFIIKRKEDDEDYWQRIRSQLNIGQVRLSIFYILTSNACNFNCKYCYMLNNETKANTIEKTFDKTNIKKVVDLIKKLPTEKELMIIFYGGEPLIDFNTVKKFTTELEAALLGKKLVFQIVTNGALINKTIGEFFKKHSFLVSVSLDGPQKITDLWRKSVSGNSAYDLANNGINTLISCGIKPGISCTITPHNYEVLIPTVMHFMEKCDVKSIGFNPWLEFDGIKNKDINFEKMNTNLFKAYEYLNSKKIYEDRINRKVESFMKRQIKVSDCGAIGNQLVFFPNGDVGICHAFQNKYIIGNVKNLESDIVANNLDLKLWANRTPFNIDECKFCPAIAICGGGCPHNAYVQNGSIFTTDKNFCIHSKMALNWLLNRVYKLQ